MDTNILQNTNDKKIGRIVCPWVVTMVGAAIMLLLLLLPFATATKEHKEDLLKYSDKIYVQELEMTCKDVVDVSLLEYARVYNEVVKQEYQRDAVTASMVIIAIYGGLSLLVLLLAVFRKPIGVIIFDALAMGAFWIIRFDFEDRGVVPSSSYNWGISSWLAYVMGAVVAVGAVWLLVEKIKINRARKSEKVNKEV